MLKVDSMDELADIKRDVKEILDLLKGSELQRGNGLIDRVMKLEKVQNSNFKIIGVIGGVATIMGYFLAYVTKWIFTIFTNK